jgi:polynucleotide 5'-hydroxyl-kinase GRC3/NOL9
MNQTVERGKTLLVDGPASVTLISGKAEVFGSSVNVAHKVVIREGKRLPFAVMEKAAFDVSLGENASAEEVDEDTIPAVWAKSFEELLRIQNKPVIVMVLGTVDSGKTSFCTYLMNRLLREKQRVAILDGDLGQSDVGPPCTVAYTFATKPITDLFSLEAKNAFFVGSTSPSTAVDRVIQGLTLLKREVLCSEQDYVVINTDGWVEGEEAFNYKVQLIRALDPSVIFCLQQGDELSSFLSIPERSVTVVDSPATIRQRTREKRRSLRELGYIKYLRSAKVQSLPVSWLRIEEDDLLGLSRMCENNRQAEKVYDLLGMKPLHFAELKDKICVIIGKNRWIGSDNIRRVREFTRKEVMILRKGEEEGLLLALYNVKRKFLGIGILREVDYARKTLKIFTPISKEISIVSLGKVKLDKNFREIPVLAEDKPLSF